MSANTATADFLGETNITSHVVKWIGGTSTDWFDASNWVELLHDTHGPTNRVAEDDDVAHWDGNWTGAYQCEISGGDAIVDELRVSQPTNEVIWGGSGDVVLTVDNGATLHLYRNSGAGIPNSIRMNVAEKDLTITGSGTFIQHADPTGDARWYVWRNTATGGDLTIDTAGFEIEEQVLAINVNGNAAGTIMRTVDIRSSCGPTAASIDKNGRGILILRGQNQWTGFTDYAGILELGTNNAIHTDSAIISRAGSTLKTHGYDGEFGTLEIRGNGVAVIDFGNTNGLSSQLAFDDSSDTNVLIWASGTALSITNFTEGVDTFRIGTNDTGLISEQLAKIKINGSTNVFIDPLGYLVTEIVMPDLVPIGDISYEIVDPENDMELSWEPTSILQIYQVQYTDDLELEWQNYTNITAMSTNGLSLTVPTDLSQAFFRIMSDSYEGYPTE
jgi:hypothetical protein